MFETNIENNNQSTTKNQSKKPEFKKTGPAAYTNNYVRYPTNVMDYLIQSNLDYLSKITGLQIITFIIRFTNGWHINSMFFDWATLRTITHGSEKKITRIVQGLIKLNILKGGPVEQYADGRIRRWELSVNEDVTKWDISILPERRTAFREQEKLARNLTNSKKAEKREAISQNPIPGCELAPELGVNWNQVAKTGV